MKTTLATLNRGHDSIVGSDYFYASIGSKARTVRELIDLAAEVRPECIYLISPETEQALSFKDLQQGAKLLSARLIQTGLEHGDKVAFLLDNGLFAAQLFFGVMYGGLVSVPLNVNAGVSQLAYMIDHCDAKAIFVSEEYTALINEVMPHVQRQVRVIPADLWADPETAEASLSKPLPPAPEPEDEALLMYSSGSTGRPKGALHSHRALLAAARNSVSAHELSSVDRSLLVLPLYHINAECVTLVPTLISGGSVAIPYRFSVSRFWDWLDEFRCTWSAVVPTIISQLLDWKDPLAGSRADLFNRLRFLRSSSAPLAPSLHREFMEKFKILLIQAMGSSEAGNIFSNPLPPRQNKIGSPGLAWGFEAKIINRDGAELASGDPGEILLRGPAMMYGYYKEPDATAAVLDGDGWFHTGDLAYRDADGYFFVVGRAKELIIKGGVNIAPRQIDDVLEAHPAILEAAAIGVPDRHLGEDVIAFVVLRAGATVDETELLTFCEGRLGHFKTPTRIHFADDLPKGPSGKVQRLRLLEEGSSFSIIRGSSEFAKSGSGTSVVQNGLSATASIQKLITECWAEILETSNIDTESNFFALGGHSLLAVRCLSRLREKISVALSLSDFFDNGTIAKQTALVIQRLHRDSQGMFERNSQAQSGSSGALQPIPLRDRSLPCPLSPGQRSLWFTEQLSAGVPLYNESEAVRLVGELDEDALESAFRAIVSRHEVLRTTMQVIDGEPFAVVSDDWSPPIRKVDLSALSPSNRQEEVQRLLVHEPQRPFNLESEPGIRATLLRLSPSEHVFILMMHHIICDWASEGIFWRELASAYRSFRHNEPVTLPALDIQFGDYAAWTVQETAHTHFEEDLAYWEDTLRGAPEVLDLPADRPRPAALSNRGARLRLRLDPTLTTAVRRLSKRTETTLFTIFVTALNVLLYRYSGREDILIGVPVADRDQKELQDLIGFLLQVQVLRTPVSPEMSFRELLSRVQKQALALYEHRAAPFEQVVSRTRPKRSLSYSPLFQTMFIWRDREQMLPFIGLEGLQMESLLSESKTSKFDLTAFATDCGDEFWLDLEYSTDMFDDCRIARMLEHFRGLLECVAEDPDVRVAEAQFINRNERQQILDRHLPATDYPVELGIHQLFEIQAQQRPSAIAVTSAGRQLTYGDLDQQSDRLAVHLQSLGVGPGDLVAVCVERSVEMAVALLGVLKAGGAYLPLDPSFPPERLEFILEDARPRALIAQTSLPDKRFVFRGPRVFMDRFPEAVKQSVPSHHQEEAGLAYVLYTSGSTGKPKGVEVCHRAVVNFLCSMRANPGLDERDTLLSVTTFSFDIFGLELWLPLTTGAQTVICSEETAKDAEGLAKAIRKSGATVMQATPATWRLLLEGGWPGVPSLKILCGGEAWSEDLAAKLLPKCGSLWNMYGPTETTIWSAVSQVKAGAEVVIGPPISNTQFHVVDSNLQLQPLGVPGELLIGGDGLARGYLNRADLTNEKFINNPFNPRSRVYRTGDLVQSLPDGTYRFLGRLDNQIKIHGFRIELGEIESVLMTHPQVRAAAVVHREGEDADLVAYVVASHISEVTDVELRQFTQKKLPHYMIPARFEFLSCLPLTANGKVNRNALPAPTAQGRSTCPLRIEPRDSLERDLVVLWERILRVQPVQSTDNFFDLGGHSFAATRLMSEIETLTGRKLPLATLFRTPTVEALANILREAEQTPWSSLVSIYDRGSTQPLFLVHGAEGNVMLYRKLADCLQPDVPVYGLQSRGLTGEATHQESIAEMATHYIKEMLEVQPEGPYFIGGYCMGGIIAFEIAQQLQLKGKTVGLVLLLETYNISTAPRKTRGPLRYLLQGAYFYGANIAILPAGERWKFLQQKLNVASHRLTIRFQEIRDRYLRRGAGSGRHKHHSRVRLDNDRASLGYTPTPYRGRVALIRPRIYFAGLNDPTFGWDRVVGGGLEIREIPVYPRGMLVEPFCHSLAETVKFCLVGAGESN
jgi:amino acid adenylation domain-containing protein